jgi:transglutaminase-like putative cysteine protease
MLLRVIHQTHFHFEQPAEESRNEARLMPLTDETQVCRDFRLTIEPSVRVSSYEEIGGTVHCIDIPFPHRDLLIHAESLVETRRTNPFEGLNLIEDDSAFYTRGSVRQDYAGYLAPTRSVPAHPDAARIAGIARRYAGAATASFLLALTRLLYRLRVFEPGEAPARAALEPFLTRGGGISRDFTHLMLAVCRSQSIPCRYVSGYVLLDRNARSGQESDAMHAWVECLLPGGIWRGFDPTYNLLANDRYVRVHTGCDYRDVSPTRGLYRGPEGHTVDVRVSVRAAEE